MHSRQVVERCKAQILTYLDDPVYGGTAGHLMLACGLEKALRTADGISEYRVLDRALKALRGAGQIEFVNRAWRKKVSP